MRSGGAIWRGRRVLAAGMAAGLLAAAGTSAAAAAGGPAPGTTRVSYRGYTFRVPAGWPVIRLAGHPHACVRFDRHAVYLGTPPASPACPATVLGVAGALLIQPASGQPAHAVDNPVARRITVTTPRVAVTASYGADRAQVLAILASASLPAPVTRLPVRPRFGPMLLRAWASSYTGPAFDACAAPSLRAMRAWRAHSPYRGIGIYIGGQDRGCAQPNLTAAWVSQQVAAGWRLIPLYVGPQASFGELTAPVQQATSAAHDAATAAGLLGLGPGTPLYYDMEAYPPRYAAKALAFMSAWTAALHSLGYRSAIYSSSLSGIRDLAQNVHNPAYVMPDIVYDAWWNGAASIADPVFPPGAWALHRRVHQYAGNVTSRFGGVKINIDRDFMDVQLAAGGSGRPQLVRGHWAWARGGLRFAQLARRNGVTWFKLHNPALPGDYRLTTRYLGRKVPRGTRWWVPAHLHM